MVATTVMYRVVMTDVLVLATVVAVFVVVPLLVRALATPTAAAVAVDIFVSDNDVVAGVTNAAPFADDVAVVVAYCTYLGRT